MTTIKTRNLRTGTANGRPVKFSRAAWVWYYTDTPGNQPAEYVRGQVWIVRK